jgi:nucleoside-diphosphate-sugar epimerase
LRLLLDAHVSGRAIGRELRDMGHDVLALDEHRELEGLDDPVVLDLAATKKSGSW